MAETVAGGFRNTRLVLVAIVLGIVFVVLLNLQRAVEARRLAREQVSVVLVKTDMAAGQVLTTADVEPVSVPREVAQRARGLYRFDELELGITRVQRPVARNDLLRLSDMRQPLADEDALARLMPAGRQAVTLPVDSREPSAFVKPGARIDLWGPLPMPGQAVRAQLIIENLEVLSVDGQADPGEVRRSIRSVEVHVPADLVPRLKEVQRRLAGPMSVSVRAPGDMDVRYPYDRTRPELGGTIAQPVLDSLARPFTPSAAAGAGEWVSPFSE